MSGIGGLSCFDISGNLKWRVDTGKVYDSQKIYWGLAESPLVVDNKVICTPGGSKATMVAFDKKTGKEVWKCSNGTDKGSMVYADGMLYCYAESGTVGLVIPTPSGFSPASTFKITEGSGKHWAHPAISDGVLYIRHGEKLMAYSIKAK